VKPARAAVLAGLLRLFALLPLPAAHAIGAFLGWLFWLLPTEARRVTRINLALCLPELDPHQRARLARRSLMETGKTFTETGALWFWAPQRVLDLVREVRGLEHLEAAEGRGRGLIGLTPHLGAWELTSLYYAARQPITCLYRPPRLAELQDLVRRARERMGPRLVPTTPSGIKALYRALARHQAVGILPDQDPGRHGGVFAPFFGRPAGTMVLIPRLAHKTGAPAVFVFAERLPRGRGYRLVFHPAPAELAAEDPAVGAAALNRGVETCVRALPEQYQWSYKRFKSRPAGESPRY
jgi:KDO2-lipid IV(A) lauroyltransferase